MQLYIQIILSYIYFNKFKLSYILIILEMRKKYANSYRNLKSKIYITTYNN